MTGDSPNAVQVTPEMIRAVTEYMQKVQIVTFDVKCQSCGHPDCIIGHYDITNHTPEENFYVLSNCKVCDNIRGPCRNRALSGR